MTASDHEYWMQIALEEARIAAAEDEIPVGAILVKGDQIIRRDHNRTRQLRNPLAHAEKLIVDKILASGIRVLEDHRLYVTLEPCLMCAGMLILARLDVLIIGASDPKAGAVGSVYNVLLDKSFNHHPTIVRGVLKESCSAILTSFFHAKRT